MRHSKQLETHQDNFGKVLYAQGSSVSSFHLTISAGTSASVSHDFRSLEPSHSSTPSPVGTLGGIHFLVMAERKFPAGTPHLLKGLQTLVPVSTRQFWGWLERFSSEQNDEFILVCSKILTQRTSGS